MGWGGTLCVVNATPYTWIRTFQPDAGAGDMSDWSLPEKIKPGEIVDVYAEFKTATTHDWALTQYSFGDHSPAIELGINGSDFGNGFYYLHLIDVSTLGNPKGARIETPFVHNGSAFLFLGGTEDSFISSNPPGRTWMSDTLSAIGEQTLRTICLLESHDAGMSLDKLITKTSPFVTPANVRTQTRHIGEQLADGVRFFDVRPVVSSGAYFTGHYSNTRTPLRWQGANGVSIAEIIAHVNLFTASCAELVILDFSHAYDSDSAFVDFDQKQWDGLFALLASPSTGLRHLYHAPAGTGDLTTLTVNDFIGKGRAAVVCLIEAGRHIRIPAAYEGKGFYTKSRSFPVRPAVAYSNTDHVGVMTEDQRKKLARYKTRREAPVVETSWTLTQVTGAEAAGFGPSILDLAYRAKNKLFPSLWRYCSADSFPNLLVLDNVDSTDYLALAMAITWWFSLHGKERGVMCTVL
ncbi:hypothetical protein CkaCkLH20_09241 [Colletotrichum karsti]|uniref:PLC-like phosphodiesterase n=1 Tax=Colletotrichum karsti TaxID=1095194 RepID=A0A9P6HXQ2_9PEZI|nr:uncharacterized protein CkaCkLH20_09241 [Colletotrichum karsti]KAF9873428.1 hypothetical protein CkaCkLH20_09241 [Colletotrichum karsti]